MIKSIEIEAEIVDKENEDMSLQLTLSQENISVTLYLYPTEIITLQRILTEKLVLLDQYMHNVIRNK